MMSDIKLHILGRDTENGFDVSELVTNIEYTSFLYDNPSKLTFTLKEDPKGNLTLRNGMNVRFWHNDEKVFYGYIFTISFGKNEEYNVTAYDTLRYFQNHWVYSMKSGSTLKDMFEKVCREQFNFKEGVTYEIRGKARNLDSDTYSLPKLNAMFFNDVSYYEMLKTCIDYSEIYNIYNAIQTKHTYMDWWNTEYKDPIFFIRCEWDKVILDDIQNAFITKFSDIMRRELPKPVVLGEKSLVTDYKYELDIDSETCNQIIAYADIEETQRESVKSYLASDNIVYSTLDEYLTQFFETEEGTLHIDKPKHKIVGAGTCVAFVRDYWTKVFLIQRDKQIPTLGGNYNLGAYSLYDSYKSNKSAYEPYFTMINADEDFNKGDVIVWDKSTANKYGHIAIAYENISKSTEEFRVVEENGFKSSEGVVSVTRSRSGINGGKVLCAFRATQQAITEAFNLKYGEEALDNLTNGSVALVSIPDYNDANKEKPNSIIKESVDRYGLLRKTFNVKTSSLNQIKKNIVGVVTDSNGYFDTDNEQYAKLSDEELSKRKLEMLLNYYTNILVNKCTPKKTLNIEALGFDGLYAGDSFVLDIDKINIDKSKTSVTTEKKKDYDKDSGLFFINSATHKYTNGVHTMSLDVYATPTMKEFI